VDCSWTWNCLKAAQLTRLSIFAAAREVPTQLALITENARFTYRELAELCIGRVAALTRVRGLVLLQPQLDLDSVLWLYALASTGTPFLALHPQATAHERAAAQALTGAQDLPAAQPRSAPPTEEREIHPEDPFAFMLTSGSTGASKVVVLSRRAVLASAAASEHNLGLDDQERWLLCLPLSHVAGLSIIVRMLGARRTVVLFAPGTSGLLARMRDLGRELHEQRVTLVSLIPALLARLLDDGFRPPATLRAVLLGGAGCTPDLAVRARHAHIPLLTSYGLTETGSQIAARRYTDRYSPLAQRDGCVSSGQPLAGVEMRLVGERIAIRAASMFSGYVDAATAAVDPHGWFVTTDRGALGPAGEIYVLGRTDAVIVTGGEKVDPEEVERALRALPEVLDACVFGLSSREFGQRVVAVVVPTATTRVITLDQLTVKLSSRLARFKLPQALAIADALPITASGKLDRATCITRFGPAL
jgi:O-succinylbenzoic acid--CoA ligase